MTEDLAQGSFLTLAVLISGSGSNLQSIINAVNNRSLAAKIATVVSNKEDAYGIQRAKSAGIYEAVIDHRQFSNREDHEIALAEHIDQYSPDLIVLAGYMRILSPWFINRFPDKILNIHPSLLPKYKGTNTHQRVLDAGETEHGASVHLVTDQLDGGPVVIQAKVPVYPDDDVESLRNRVLEREHVIYPEAIRLFSLGKVRARDSILYFK